jgi:hypothetical protein
VPSIASPQVAVLAIGGIVLGLVLLWRGFGGYRTAARIGDTGTSRIATLAAGEVRITGIVEPAELTLVSPLQSVTAVWYRAKVAKTGGEGEDATIFEEEQGVGFRVRDETGSIRVFPRGAAIDVPTDYDEKTGTFGEEPIGLAPRRGSKYGPGAILSEADREAQIAALLTVRPAAPLTDDLAGAGGGFGAALGGGLLGGSLLGGAMGGLGVGSRGRMRYQEARLEPGDVVTVLGIAQPFGHLSDPLAADALQGGLDPHALLADPEIAGDIAEAREAGVLVSREVAWGNAAIPGFGIGKPVTAPEIDPEAEPLSLASAEERARIAHTFDLAPDVLVLASTPEARLIVADGSPGQAVGRQEQRFLVGLLGAVLAIGSAVVLAISVGSLL